MKSANLHKKVQICAANRKSKLQQKYLAVTSRYPTFAPDNYFMGTYKNSKICVTLHSQNAHLL